MHPGILQNMNLNELRDLFIVKITELLKLTEQKNADGIRIRDLKQEIEYLQEIINLKKGLQASKN